MEQDTLNWSYYSNSYKNKSIYLEK